ncbi:expressed unknown protein [Seminavis robusta]|uniref:Uncharacterized protein n=1 Tax=Seminavis robusta TaxID=568900 RepID=A0A9N8DE32_9STRA|nr:expressed unknown protein [Seminavis robusta]|eukprot:Sro99_g051030.1 n/a (217) ;mRNA; f:100264-100914
MEYLKLAAHLNTCANQLLLTGDASQAFGHYRTAIRLLSQCQQVTSDQENDNDDRARHAIVGQVSLARRCLTEQDMMEKECFASPVFEFAYHGNDKEQDQDQELTLNMLAYYSAVLIYNCAVCLHKRGGWSALQKANTLYNQCIELVQPLITEPSTATSCHHYELMACVLRNQANIFYQLNDFSNVKYLMDKVFLLQQQERMMKSAQSSANAFAPEA